MDLCHMAAILVNDKPGLQKFFGTTRVKLARVPKKKVRLG